MATVTGRAPHMLVQRVAMTLDIKPDLVDEYIAAHATPRHNVVAAMRSAGLRNLSLWVSRERLFYYAEFVPIGMENFDQAMERYARMPGVKEWEEEMHKYQARIPGTESEVGATKNVWWQVCKPVYYQA